SFITSGAPNSCATIAFISILSFGPRAGRFSFQRSEFWRRTPAMSIHLTERRAHCRHHTMIPQSLPARMDHITARHYTSTVNSEPDVLTPLRRYWGYDVFRPMQERIVRSLLAGRDTCVVMPTGGGKSLCYQLPAAMSADKTVVVISPLIALMQDQVAQLEQMGIPSAFVNSSLGGEERSRVLKRAEGGEFRLLYF